MSNWIKQSRQNLCLEHSNMIIKSEGKFDQSEGKFHQRKWGQIPPKWGQIRRKENEGKFDPRWGQIRPKWGQIRPKWGQIKLNLLFMTHTLSHIESQTTTWGGGPGNQTSIPFLQTWWRWPSDLLRTSPDIISKSILTTHKVTRNLKFWPKIIGWPLWKKIQDGGHQNLTSPYMVWMSWLLPKNITRHHFQVRFDHRQSYKKFEILTQNHRLTPLEKIKDGG